MPYTSVVFKSCDSVIHHLRAPNSVIDSVIDMDSKEILSFENPGFLSFPVNNDFLPKDLTTSLSTNFMLNQNPNIKYLLFYIKQYL